MKITTHKIIPKTLLFGTIFMFSISHCQSKSQNNFTEVKKGFPRKEKNLRKWDAPVVVDLDQDGYLDLLINDHGFGVQVCWNNKGEFAKPLDIIMGDLHGISAGDFDRDGFIEVIMSRGGGSGSNARNSKLFKVINREFIAQPDFNPPLELMRGRTVKFADLNNDGSLDLLNFAFPDKQKQGDSENYIYKNNGLGTLLLQNKLPSSKGDGQKSLLTDINNDNVLDIILYGNASIKVYQGTENFNFKEVSTKVLPFLIERATSIVEIDFDNDGDLDLYISRGEDFKKEETFYNKQTKAFGFYTKRGMFKIPDIQVGDVLEIENLQTQWPYNEALFLGETGYNYEFKGETHSGRNIRLTNSNALGFPDKMDFKHKKGIYLGYVGNTKWRLAGYLWSPSTGVIHNVKDYKEKTYDKALHDILLENKKGLFKDVTNERGVYLKENTVTTTVADFDNNGFQDLMIRKRGNLVFNNKTILYLNKGIDGFENYQDHNIVTKELGSIGLVIETIDYDKDGNQDVVIGDERGKWHLFKNELDKAKTNNYITITVGNSSSNKATALGALVSIESCTGIQQKRIGSTGANYSLSFNNQIHFGLGTCKKTVIVKVKWSNGEEQKKEINTFNTNVFIGEQTKTNLK
ncbi:CRTAC1 family protein [Tenacibaculum sp. M341]|uniref:CRTAC1 family protein n=1 Tax=Tenacibaculum sp. M341 TaxID=2530339 RepID=UPI001052DE39|nr:CRTAC1 family protein [Tenacibaculum sp. M341]TCI90387.1 CRTAC1 family protein [Tenacibaculum sp. M341]